MKIIHKISAALLCILAFASSCTEKELNDNEIVLDEIVKGVGMKSVTLELEIPMEQVSNAWYLYSPSADTWLTYQVIPGTRSLWVMVDGNTTGEIRSSHITIRCEGYMQKIVINQDSEPVLKLSTATCSVRYTEDTKRVMVVNPDEVTGVTVSVPEEVASWCSATVDANKIMVSCTENPSADRRSTTLTVNAVRTISGESCTAEFEVVQLKSGEQPAVEFSVDEGSTWLDEIPETFTQLAVRTNDGSTFSEGTLHEIITFAGNSTVSLDFSQANYSSLVFPDVFKGSQDAPNLWLKNIVLPANVTAIADQAFIYCTALESVKLDGIVKIGEQAFRYCGLKTLNVPESVASYGTYVFADNAALTDVYYNSPYDSGSSSSGNVYAFYLEETEVAEPKMVLTIGPAVKYVPRTLVRHNNSLVKIICEDAVYFRQYAFPYCENLAEFEFRCMDESKISNAEVFAIKSAWDSGHIVAGARCDSKKIIVPAGLENAYYESGALNVLINVGYEFKVTLPAGVQLSANGTEWTSDVPAGFTSLAVRTTDGTNLKSVHLTFLRDLIAEQTSPVALDLSGVSFESTTFPATFAGTESAPFTKLSSIKFPAGVTEIVDEAFYYCSSLQAVDLTGIAKIGKSAFQYCSLVNLTVPESVVEYGTYVFANNPTLTTVYYNSPYNPGNNKVYAMFTFALPDPETNGSVADPKLVVTVGPAVERTPRCFLRNNTSLVKLIFEDALTIGNYGLVGCVNLAEVEFKCADQAKITDYDVFKMGTAWDVAEDKVTPTHIVFGRDVDPENRKFIVPAGCKSYYEVSPLYTDYFIKAGYTVVEAQ